MRRLWNPAMTADALVALGSALSRGPAIRRPPNGTDLWHLLPVVRAVHQIKTWRTLFPVYRLLPLWRFQKSFFSRSAVTLSNTFLAAASWTLS